MVVCVIIEADVDKTTAAMTKHPTRDACNHVAGRKRERGERKWVEEDRERERGKERGEVERERGGGGRGREGLLLTACSHFSHPFCQSKVPSIDQSFHLIPGSFHFSMLSLSVVVHKSQRYV